MQHGRAHIGKLAQFSVSDRLDLFRVRDDIRVCDQKAGYVRPVFVNIRMNRLCNDRTGDIGAASGERANASVRICAIKARHNRVFHVLKAFAQYFVGLYCIEFAIFLKKYDLCRIDKFISQISRHYDTV